MPEQLEQVVVVPGVGSLAAPALAEHELVVQILALRRKAVAVHVNALLGLLAAAQDHFISLFQVAVLHHRQVAVVTDHHTGIHAALLRQHPFPIDLEILRVHGGAVVIFRRHTVHFRLLKLYVRGVYKHGLGKIRMMVFR